ncbi:MAG: YqgE/AlgH family protein [Opitutaceae bacterium]|jgi:putative transcriptional regulator|nr:YqgE/AlgH family protein [Opitutaceae bacterium]
MSEGGEDGSLAGRLLVASPRLEGRHFRHSVVLLAAHDEEGAMGIVLNRPLGRRLGGLSVELSAGPLAEVPLLSGGPVEEERLALCVWREHLGPGTTAFQFVFGLPPEKAEAMARNPGVRLRAFLGHAGWEGGQLESELAEGSWAVVGMTPETLRGEMDASLWRRLAKELGDDWRIAAGEPEELEAN